MLMKILIIATLLVILYCLFSGLFFLVKDKGDGKRVVKALTWRISISILLFLFLLVAYGLGWIVPHGV